MTLWGKTSEDFDASSQPIVALKGVKLSDFGGRSLGSLGSTVMQVKKQLKPLAICVCTFSYFEDKSRYARSSQTPWVV